GSVAVFSMPNRLNTTHRNSTNCTESRTKIMGTPGHFLLMTSAVAAWLMAFILFADLLFQMVMKRPEAAAILRKRPGLSRTKSHQPGTTAIRRAAACASDAFPNP